MGVIDGTDSRVFVRIVVATVVAVGDGAGVAVVANLLILGKSAVNRVQVTPIGVRNVVDDVGTVCDIGIEALDAGGEFDGLPLDKEACVKDTCVGMKQKLEDGDTRKEANMSSVEVG